MAWPSANISLTNVDADSDSISSARADIYQAFTSLNDIIQVGPGTGGNTTITGSFSGNLAGNTLIDSVNGRILANASPQQNITQTGTYTQAVVVTTTPSYITGNLIPQNQTLALATVANVNLLTTFANATNRTTNGMTAYLGVTATSSNISMNPSDRVRALAGGLDLNLNGKSWGALSAASNTLLPIVTNGQTQNIYGTGQIGQAVAIGTAITITPVAGSISAQYVSSNFPTISYAATGSGYTASNINTARLYTGSIVATGNLTITNAIGLHTYSGWTSSNVSLVTNAYTILNEDARSTIQTNGNIVSTGSANKYGTMQTFNEQVVALGTVSGTQTVNLSLGSIQTMTVTGNITINTTDITNAVAGSSFTIIITQDATGGRTLTSNLRYTGGNCTLSTAANSVDTVRVVYDGARYLARLDRAYIAPTVTSYTARYLTIAGGGGGGGGAGGGAGGLLTGNTTVTVGTTYSFTIGAGGTGVNATNTVYPTQGANTSAFSLTAIRGGAGGFNSSLAIKSGGSGGGNDSAGQTGAQGNGTGTAGQGNDGGSNLGSNLLPYGAGGGGGAGAVGGTGGNSYLVGGTGGAGLASDITGTSLYWAGGGGGATTFGGTPGAGGAGGGGGAACGSGSGYGTGPAVGASGGSNGGGDGTPGGASGAGGANTGGGGGGSWTNGTGTGGAGGSGVVIISVPTANYTGVTTGSPTVTTSGSNTILKFTSSGSYTA